MSGGWRIWVKLFPKVLERVSLEGRILIEWGEGGRGVGGFFLRRRESLENERTRFFIKISYRGGGSGRAGFAAGIKTLSVFVSFGRF